MRMKRNLKAIPVLVAGLFTSQLSIAAGSVSADPHAGHDMSAMQMPADENFTEMTSMEPIVTESRTPIPPVTNRPEGCIRQFTGACDSRQCD
jgi:copper resistance protein B